MKARYLKMLQGMARKRGPRDWSVYMLRCDGGTLYTGVTKDVERRLRQHETGRGAAYTRIRPPLELVFREDGLTRSKALIREAGIKAMPKKKKENMVRRRRTGG